MAALAVLAGLVAHALVRKQLPDARALIAFAAGAFAVCLLPISGLDDPEADPEEPFDYVYEPSAPQVLDSLLRRQIEIQLFQIFQESLAGEHGARMTAMDSATSNASEMIGSLTLTYNRARQAAITTELIEVVSGADALRG